LEGAIAPTDAFPLLVVTLDWVGSCISLIGDFLSSFEDVFFFAELVPS